MRGIVTDGKSLAFRTDVEDPTPGPDDVAVAPTRVLVSAFDLFIAQQAFQFEGIPGRAFVGTVESGGDAGSRVVGSGSTWTDDDDMVAAGFRSHARTRTIPGMLNRAGALADRIVLPKRNVAAVGVGIDDDHAMFAEPLAGALQALRQISMRRKPFVSVIGDTLQGLLMVQVLSELNASVRLLGRDERRLTICEKWGIKHRMIGEAGRRADQDVVVVCSSEPEDLAVAMRMLRPRGDLVLKMVPDIRGGQMTVDLSPIIVHEFNVVGSWDGPVNDALSMLQRSEVDVLSLISKRCRLQDAADLPTLLAQPGCVAVAVDI